MVKVADRMRWGVYSRAGSIPSVSQMQNSSMCSIMFQMSAYNNIQQQPNEDSESTRNSDSDACLCLAFGLGLFVLFCVATAYIFSPSQAMIDARHQSMDHQIIDYCSNRCCYSRYRNTYNRQYGLYSSQKVFRVQAGVGCVYCPDRRYLDYHYDCKTSVQILHRGCSALRRHGAEPTEQTPEQLDWNLLAALSEIPY